MKIYTGTKESWNAFVAANAEDGGVLQAGEWGEQGEEPQQQEAVQIASEEFQRIAVRAQTSVENFGVVNCTMGQEVQRQMGKFLGDTSDVR